MIVELRWIKRFSLVSNCLSGMNPNFVPMQCFIYGVFTCLFDLLSFGLWISCLVGSVLFALFYFVFVFVLKLNELERNFLSIGLAFLLCLGRTVSVEVVDVVSACGI